jgi:hypothetical protein
MQHAKVLEVMRRALRSEICAHCSHRPSGSESLASTVSRTCEPLCPIFKNLPRLQSIARRVEGPAMAPYELAVLNRVCQHCDGSLTAGDYCQENLTRDCPLSRYMAQVMTVIERVLALPHEKSRPASPPR